MTAISSFRAGEMLLHVNELPGRMVLAYLWPGSITARSLRNPPARSPGDFKPPGVPGRRVPGWRWRREHRRDRQALLGARDGRHRTRNQSLDI
jgi:hypothetical protein